MNHNVTQLLLTTLQTYKNNIRIKQLGGAGSLNDAVRDIIKNTHNISTTDNEITKIYNKLKSFEIDIDKYIAEIELLHSKSNISKIESTNNEKSLIDEKLDKMRQMVTQIINAQSFYSSLFPEPEIIQINKQDDHLKILSLYELVLTNYKKDREKIKKLDMTHDGSNYIYSVVNASIIENIKLAQQLITQLKQINSNLEKHSKLSLGDYNKSEIVLSTDDIYNYTKRLNTSTSEINIVPARLDNLLDVCEGLIESLKLNENIKLLDLDEHDVTNPKLLEDLIEQSQIISSALLEKKKEIKKFKKEHVAKISTNTLSPKLANEGYELIIAYKTLKIQSDDIQSQIDKMGMTGGYNFINSSIVNDLNSNFANLTTAIVNCEKELETFYGALVKYKIFKIQHNNFILYMLSIVVSNKFTEKQIHYTHINKGFLQFYLTILDKLHGDMKMRQTRADTLYFFQNHYLTISEMRKFLKFMVRNIKTSDIIDIEKCTGSVKKSFAIFNYFKDILDSYNEVWDQNKINIYARINDWNDGSPNTLPMFMSDPDDAKMLVINKTVCKQTCAGVTTTYCSNLTDGTTKVKFSEVFDSKEFTQNNEISKHMTLETQLSKKKGIMLMTYGYSGTGKTFTLFGASNAPVSITDTIDKSKQGLLQATLNNIRGLDEVRFRVMELYGFGVQYPHYWKGNVKQYVIKYKLGLVGDNEIDIIEPPVYDPDVVGCFSDTTNGFITLKENNVEKVFKNFDKFIKKLDTERKSKGRIRITSNNPESSRSIVIYEFHLLVENSYVPFIIIDLPGREEIVETYRDNYLNRSYENIQFVKPNLKTEFHKTILTCMSVNPLGLSILVPSIIIKTFNSLDPLQKNKILGEYAGVRLKNENFGLGNNHLDLELLMEVESSQEGKQIKMIDNPQDNIYCDKIIDFPRNSDKSMKVSAPVQIPSNINSIQYQGVLALFFINRIILMGEFGVFETLYQNIIETYFKNDTLLALSFDKKKEILKSFFDESRIDKLFANNSNDVNELNDLFDQITNFRTYLAPFEGIYINENIMGLIKVMAHNITDKDDTYISNYLMKTQDTNLNFETQKRNIREINFGLYLSLPNDNTEPYENIYRNITKLKEMQIVEYSSQKIFEYEHPFIESIIDLYKSQRIVNGVVLEPVAFFKMFYLFSNTQMKKKCTHQWKLLHETISFINTINTSK